MKKPHIKLVSAKPAAAMSRESTVDAARRRFGQRFAHESGATWKPRSTPLLTEWMQSRSKT